MNRADEPGRQNHVTLPPTPAAQQELLTALLWIGCGGGALLLLCTLGPALVTYATSAGLPLLVLAPLISSIIAGWDVGGLLLMIVGIRRLMTAWRMRQAR